MTAKALLSLIKAKIAEQRKLEKTTCANREEKYDKEVGIHWELVNLAIVVDKMWYSGDLTDLQYQRMIDLLGEEGV